VIEIDILGIPVAAQRFEEAIELLRERAAARRRTRVHFATVHTLVEARDNADLRAALQTADIVATDGMPLVWVARLRGARGAQRLCGPDLMPRLCDIGRADGLRHYFIGGAAGTPEALAARLAERFPGLAVAGTCSPPFRTLSEPEEAAQLQAIDESRADVVWVGLGTPKQDLWAARNASRLEASLVLTVGAAFDFHSGRLRRAPRWMQRLGLEWLFRLAMEPRRLAGRYIATNARFAYIVLREELGRRLRRSRTRR
jgi:N-acetylglucosaminyldiphosphoundecaprenol N-acetyl-beta-D-mannosaminyltransferase